MSTNSLALQPLPERGWRNGLASLIRKENRAWSSGLRWLVQSIIWLCALNTMVAFVMFIMPAIDKSAGRSGGPAGMDSPLVIGLTMFFTLLTAFGPIGTIILAHDKVVGEKQMGTAAWILSKPVSRSAFIVSKLISGILRTLIFIVIVPGLVAYAEVSLVAGKPFGLIPFLLASATAYTIILYFLTLTLMLSVVLDQRGGILAISFGVLFGLQMVQNFVPQIGYVTPLNIPVAVMALVQEQALPVAAISSIVFTLLWSILFAVVAVWQFGRDEF